MPQYNRNDLEIAARNQHFTRDTFEKVLRLKTILDWMNTHEFLKTHLLLKGGTAINLTVFDLPRLSVDINMDFVPNLPREDMLQTRGTISGIIKACFVRFLRFAHLIYKDIRNKKPVFK